MGMSSDDEQKDNFVDPDLLEVAQPGETLPVLSTPFPDPVLGTIMSFVVSASDKRGLDRLRAIDPRIQRAIDNNLSLFAVAGAQLDFECKTGPLKQLDGTWDFQFKQQSHSSNLFCFKKGDMTLYLVWIDSAFGHVPADDHPHHKEFSEAGHILMRKHQFKLYVTSAPPAPSTHAPPAPSTHDPQGDDTRVKYDVTRVKYVTKTGETRYYTRKTEREPENAQPPENKKPGELTYYGFRNLDHPVIPVGSCEQLLPAVLSAWKNTLGSGTWCDVGRDTKFRILNPEAMSQRPDELPRESAPE